MKANHLILKTLLIALLSGSIFATIPIGNNESPTEPLEGKQACIFLDADNRPIVNMPVEIRFSSNQSHTERGIAPTEPYIMAQTLMLDENGHITLPVPTEANLHVSYYVIHKDCGPVFAGPGLYNGPEGYRQFHVPVLPKEKWTVFTDALGQPIPNATVAIYSGQTYERRTHPNPTIYQLDSQGRLKPPQECPRLEHSCFVVSHPDYGTAITEPRSKATQNILETCTVPLVLIGTEAQVRSIWGAVVDPNGEPLSGVVLECRYISTPSGGTMGLNGGYHCKTLTDDDGLFSLYMPIEQTDQNDIKLVPLASTYIVTVKPPKEMPFKEKYARIISGVETAITLEYSKPQTKFFHTFSFEDENGPITNHIELMLMKINIKPKVTKSLNPTSTIEYKDYKNGGLFPLGTYTAHSRSRDQMVFQPVEVTKNSPEHLVFRAIPSTTKGFSGLIIYGPTGEPIEGAAVFLRFFLTEPNPADLTDEQWQAIYNVASQPDIDRKTRSELLSGLRLAYETAALSDSSGSYYISHSSAKPLSRLDIVALKKGYMGACQHRMPLKADFERMKPEQRARNLMDETNSLIQVPTLELYPEAKIIFEPNFPVDWKKERPQIEASWRLDPNDNPSWVLDFLNYQRRGGLYYINYIHPNVSQGISVPAGLNMSLTFTEDRINKWHPTVIPDIKLEQGQTLDLGKVAFEPLLNIKVRLVDSEGDSIEGVTVYARFRINGLFQRPQDSITDKNGIASFNVHPNCQAEFQVRYIPQRGNATNTQPAQPIVESVKYEITGPEDQGKQFTLQLSDKMLEMLFQ